MNKKELWESLESIGEDEVRLRLAQNIYGAKKRPLVEEWLRRKNAVEDRKLQESEQSRRDDEIQINRSSLKISRISTLTSLISVILSIGALVISLLAYQAAHTEKVVLRAQRFMGDHASQIEPQPGILGPAIIDTYWECLLSNTGDRTVSIIEANVWLFDKGGLSQYSKMRGGILDAKAKQVSFPITIEAGHSTKLLFLLRPRIVEAAFQILANAYPDNSIPSLRIAQNMLAGNNLDFFGNTIKPFFDEKKVTGFRVENSDNQPSFVFKFVTGRGKTISGFAEWYPSPGL